MVEDNVIVGNTAWEGAGIRFCFFGGVIAEPMVRRNTILDNEAGFAGGGIAIYDADPVIENCTLDGNSAVAIGGGLYATQCQVAPALLNTIVTNSTSGGGVALENAALTTSLCDVWGNTGGDYVNCGPGPTDMSADPLFCDPANRDVSLRDDSPCLPENNPWSALIGAHDAGGCGTSVSGEYSTELLFHLNLPSPNPASGPVELSYELQDPGVPVELTIFSVDGRLIRRFDAAPGAAGEHRLTWDATDERGVPVASGVYLVRGRAAGRSSYRGLVILRRP